MAFFYERLAAAIATDTAPRSGSPVWRVSSLGPVSLCRCVTCSNFSLAVTFVAFGSSLAVTFAAPSSGPFSAGDC